MLHQKLGLKLSADLLHENCQIFNITVNCIAPGPIRTDLLRGVPENKIQDIIKRQIFTKVLAIPDVVDQVNLLLSNEAKFVSGGLLL